MSDAIAEIAPQIPVEKTVPPEQDLFDEWKGSVSTKKFLWFVGKATAGFAAAPQFMDTLHSLGLTLEANSILAKLAPSLVPAILGGVLHVGQDFAALKSKAKWL